MFYYLFLIETYSEIVEISYLSKHSNQSRFLNTYQSLPIYSHDLENIFRKMPISFKYFKLNLKLVFV